MWDSLQMEKSEARVHGKGNLLCDREGNNSIN